MKKLKQVSKWIKTQIHLTPNSVLCFCFIKFIWVTLVNKIIQVSGVQFYSISSGHCIGYSPTQVNSPSITIYPPCTPSLPPFPQQSQHCCPCPWVFLFFFPFLLNPFILLTQHCLTPWQLSACSLSMSLSLFCLLVHFVH